MKAYYRRIDLNSMIERIFLQYFLFGNVYVYMKEDGHLITFPVQKSKIGNVVIGSRPIVEFRCMDIVTDCVRAGIMSEDRTFVDDKALSVRLSGFPREVIKRVREGGEWCQLDPSRCYPLQDVKEDWSRYAYPLITACLPALAKKQLISAYEDSLLNLGMRGFVHATLGDPDNKILPDKTQLTQIDRIVRKAMTTTSLATTNNWVDVKFIQAETKFLFDNEMYKDVNNDILAAGGISGIIVSGVAQDSSTFASAQVSLQTAELRIMQARQKFADMMTYYNELAVRKGIVKCHHVPSFRFHKIDLKGNGKFQDICKELWLQGVVSTKTLFETSGLDVERERERLGKERGMDMQPKDLKTESNEDSMTTNKVGRPSVGDFETDKSKSATGAQPKPSNPNGSL